MDKLIQEYRKGRKDLRLMLKEIDLRISQEEDLEMILTLKNDKSLINGMIRDMTESISLMRSVHHKIRGRATDDKVQLMDPEMIQRLEVPAIKWDPDTENILRRQILDKYWGIIESRMDLLTNKQRSTLDRWIIKSTSISDISREDGVSRQAVWVRLFGDRTNKGALRILRDGR
jgi:hypothetical protein